VEDGVSQQVDKYIDNEFLPNRVCLSLLMPVLLILNLGKRCEKKKTYCCRIVLTNVSSVPQKVEILQQIPEVRVNP